jgi:hypothetical protein
VFVCPHFAINILTRTCGWGGGGVGWSKGLATYFLVTPIAIASVMMSRLQIAKLAFLHTTFGRCLQSTVHCSAEAPLVNACRVLVVPAVLS